MDEGMREDQRRERKDRGWRSGGERGRERDDQVDGRTHQYQVCGTISGTIHAALG